MDQRALVSQLETLSSVNSRSPKPTKVWNANILCLTFLLTANYNCKSIVSKWISYHL
jgi:hypothetical protein